MQTAEFHETAAVAAESALDGGFADPAREAARAFRACLEAMARPGTIQRVAGAAPPAPLSPAAGAVLLTLADRTTPLWLAPGLDRPQLRAWIAFHLGAPLVGPEAARFAIGRWDELLPLSRFAPGLPDYPDRSATLIVETDGLAPEGARLTGPGIAGTAHLNLPEVAAFRANAARYPLGLDFLFTAGDRLAALPRTTKVEAG